MADDITTEANEFLNNMTDDLIKLAGSESAELTGCITGCLREYPERARSSPRHCDRSPQNQEQFDSMLP